MGSLQPGQGGLGKFVITGYAHLRRNRRERECLVEKGRLKKNAELLIGAASCLT